MDAVTRRVEDGCLLWWVVSCLEYGIAGYKSRERPDG